LSPVYFLLADLSNFPGSPHLQRSHGNHAHSTKYEELFSGGLISGAHKGIIQLSRSSGKIISAVLFPEEKADRATVVARLVDHPEDLADMSLI